MEDLRKEKEGWYIRENINIYQYMHKIIIGIVVIAAVVWGEHALFNKSKQAGAEPIKIGGAFG